MNEYNDLISRNLREWRESDMSEEGLVSLIAAEREEIERLLCASKRVTIQNRTPDPGYTKEMYRLLVWGETLMRSMSGWPENHPNEFVEWKEDWRKLREKINVR